MEIRAGRREKTGKAVKSLRREGLVPAVVYGKGLTNINLSLSLKEFKKVFKEAGHSSVIDLKIEGEKDPLKVLVAETQEEPIKNEVIHVDFRQVDLTQKVTAEIELKFVGDSPAVKSGQAIILTLIDSLEVEALPLDLPHDIRVDISHLENIGQGVMVKDLPIDHSKVRVLEHKEEDLVVKLDYAIQLEKEEEVKSVEEVEVLKEKKEEEGAEGETAEESDKTKEEPKAEKEEKRDKR